MSSPEFILANKPVLDDIVTRSQHLIHTSPDIVIGFSTLDEVPIVINDEIDYHRILSEFGFEMDDLSGVIEQAKEVVQINFMKLAVSKFGFSKISLARLIMFDYLSDLESKGYDETAQRDMGHQKVREGFPQYDEAFVSSRHSHDDVRGVSLEVDRVRFLGIPDYEQADFIGITHLEGGVRKGLSLLSLKHELQYVRLSISAKGNPVIEHIINELGEEIVPDIAYLLASKPNSDEFRSSLTNIRERFTGTAREDIAELILAELCQKATSRDEFAKLNIGGNELTTPSVEDLQFFSAELADLML